MSGVLEGRVKVLEAKMERMEVNPQPGQNDAFSDNLKAIRAVQDQHTRDLRRHSGMLDDLLSYASNTRADIQDFRIEVNEFKAEVTSEIGVLKTDVAEVKGTLALILERLPDKVV